MRKKHRNEAIFYQRLAWESMEIFCWLSAKNHDSKQTQHCCCTAFTQGCEQLNTNSRYFHTSRWMIPVRIVLWSSISVLWQMLAVQPNINLSSLTERKFNELINKPIRLQLELRAFLKIIFIQLHSLTCGSQLVLCLKWSFSFVD